MKKNITKWFLVFVVFLSSCSTSYELAVVDEGDENEVCHLLNTRSAKKADFLKTVMGISEDNRRNRSKAWLRKMSEFYYSDCSLILTENLKKCDSFRFLREYPFAIERITEDGMFERVSLEPFFTPGDKEMMYRFIPDWKENKHQRKKCK